MPICLNKSMRIAKSSLIDGCIATRSRARQAPVKELLSIVQGYGSITANRTAKSRLSKLEERRGRVRGEKGAGDGGAGGKRGRPKKGRWTQ